MIDKQAESRVKATQEAARMTLDQLTTYAVSRSYPDSLRKDIVNMEFQKRMVNATWKGGIYGGIAGALCGAVAGAIVSYVPVLIRNYWP
jgi:hypothetical protein